MTRPPPLTHTPAKLSYGFQEQWISMGANHVVFWDEETLALEYRILIADGFWDRDRIEARVKG